MYFENQEGKYRRSKFIIVFVFVKSSFNGSTTPIMDIMTYMSWHAWFDMYFQSEVELIEVSFFTTITDFIFFTHKLVILEILLQCAYLFVWFLKKYFKCFLESPTSTFIYLLGYKSIWKKSFFFRMAIFF